MRRIVATGLGLLLILLAHGSARAQGVTTEVHFIVDGSGSVSPEDWRIQKDGLEAALQDHAFFPHDGSISVSVIQFGSDDDLPVTRVEVAPTVLTLPSRPVLIQAIQAMQPIGGGTSTGAGILEGALGLGSAERKLCVLTDGVQNVGPSAVGAAIDVLAAGVDRISLVALADPERGFDQAAAEDAYGGVVFGGGGVTFAQSGAEVSAVLASACLNPPLELIGFEVTQGVQDWQGSVPLVARRNTLVRTFLTPLGCDLGPQREVRTTARLHGTRPDGTPLPGSPLLPSNRAHAALAACTPQRDKVEAGPWYLLPDAWVLGGELRLRLDVPSGVDCTAPGMTDPQTCSRDLSLVTTEFDGVTLFNTRWIHPASAVTNRATLPQLIEQGRRMRATLPIESWDRDVQRFSIAAISKPLPPPPSITYDCDMDGDSDAADYPACPSTLDIVPLCDPGEDPRCEFATEALGCTQADCNTTNGVNQFDASAQTYFSLWAYPEMLWRREAPTLDGPVSYALIAGEDKDALALPLPGGVAAGFFGPGGDPSAPRYDRYEWGYWRNTAPHEVAHTLFRSHPFDPANSTSDQRRASCNAVPDPFEDPFPHIGPIPGRTRASLIGPVGVAESEIWGVDIDLFAFGAYEFETNPMAHAPATHDSLSISDPRRVPAMMDYCSPPDGNQGSWPSAYNYGAILEDLRDGPSIPSIPLPATIDLGGDRMALRGTVVGSQALLHSPLPVGGPLTPLPATSRLVLEFLDASDALVLDVPVELFEGRPRQAEETPDLDVGISHFLAIVEEPVGWESIALVLDGTEVDRVILSPSPPTVSIDAPGGGALLETPEIELAWTASDADGDALSFTAEYSADGGTSWRTIATDVVDSSLLIERHWLTGSAAARFRVIASDGLHSAGATSELFEVMDSPPSHLAIDSPPPEQLYTSKQSVFLRATAWDGDDGFLDGDAIEWSSSRQGVVGSGARVDLLATDLLEGPHDLTATATDSAGNAIEQTVRVHVSRVAPPPPDFEPRISPAVQAANPGGTAEFLVTIVPLRGFDEPVEVELAPLPEGWSGGIGPATLLPGQAALVTIRIPEDAVEATVPIDVIARSGEIVYRTGLEAEVVFGLIPECFGEIAGRVIDVETGEPIEGVQIRTASTTGVVRATTDALGEFRLEGWPPGSYGFWATGDAHWPARQTVRVICEGETPVTYELLRERFGTLTGRVVEGVVDASGSIVATDVAVPDATVLVSFSAPLQADPEGRFFSDRMRLRADNQPNNYDIRGRASGYWDGDQIRVSVADGVVTQVDLPVVPICRYGGTITGQVVDQNGDPVENSTVSAPFSGQSTTTGADGRFRIDFTEAILARNNAPLRTSITANPPPGSEPGSFGTSELFTVPSEACELGFEIDLTLQIQIVPPVVENRGVIFGQITDIETGEPVANADVVAGLGLSRVDVTTDALGTYRVEDYLIATGDDTSGQVRVTASLDGEYWGAFVDAEVFAFVENRIDLELLRVRTGSVEGFVRDSVTGAPVPRASVAGVGLDNTVTDESGYYRIDEIQLFTDNQPRLYDLIASRRRSATDTEYFAQEIRFLAEADQTRRVDFELVERCGDATVRGVVVNAETLEPIEGAQLRGGAFSVFTDAQGRFELVARVGDYNAPRAVDITASASGFIPLTRRITIFCGAQITLNFGRDGGTSSIAGTVTRSDTGATLSGVFIGSEFGQVDTTSIDGGYRLDAAPLSPDGSEATWQVSATWNGTELSAPVTVRAGEEARQDFVFPPPAELDVGVDQEQTLLDPVARTLTSRVRIALTNGSSTTATHPIRITFAPDAPGVRVPDASGLDPQGNPFYLLEPHAGVTSIAPGESAQLEVTFLRDAPLAFRYEIQVTAASAPVGIFPALADVDLDGWVDGVDVCPRVPDALQADTGGLHDAPPDGIGDACQCGDVDVDGRVSLRDSVALARFLAGRGAQVDPARCDVAADAGDPERCDPVDLGLLRLALAGGPPPEQVCPASAP